MNITRGIRSALMMSFDRIGAVTLQIIVSERVISSGKWWVNLGRRGDYLGSIDQNMCRSASKAAMGRTIGSFKHNGPRRCNIFQDTILVSIPEVHKNADADNNSPSVTKRHSCRKEAKLGKREAQNGLPIRKLLSFQKGVRL